MTLLRWRDDFSVGVPDVDAEHKALISLLNRLYFMADAGGDQTEIGHIIYRLVEDTRAHLRHEENLLGVADDPNRAVSRASHQRHLNRLEAYRCSFRSNPRVFDTKQFYEFAADWLLMHIMDEDKKLAPYFKRRSAGGAAA